MCVCVCVLDLGVAERPDAYDVFISYNWSHQQLVKRIEQRLTRDAIDVWIDQHDMSM